MSIPVLSEGKRGCGFRKPGGLYLVSDGAGEACPMLPIELRRCPTCDAGIKPSRGWTWIDADAICEPGPHGSARHAERCPLSHSIGQAGLLWIGGQFYSPASFTAEAERMGISRRIPALPNEFALGATWVLCAHRSASSAVCEACGDEIDPECEVCEGAGRVPVPAIFHLFKPDRVEYVVKGDESDAEIEAMRERKITPVVVVPVEDQTTIEGTV